MATKKAGKKASKRNILHRATKLEPKKPLGGNLNKALAD